MLRSWTPEEYTAFSQNWSANADPATFEHKWTDPEQPAHLRDHQGDADHNVWGEGFQALTDYNQAISLFTSQAAAMYAMGVWEAGASVANTEFQVDWFYYPPFEGQEPLGVVGSWPANCYIVFQDRPHVEEAKEFVCVPDFARGDGDLHEGWRAAAGAFRPSGRSPSLGTSREHHGDRRRGRRARLGAALGGVYDARARFQGLRQHIDLMLTGVETPEEAAAAMEQLNVESRETN